MDDEGDYANNGGVVAPERFNRQECCCGEFECYERNDCSQAKRRSIFPF